MSGIRGFTELPPDWASIPGDDEGPIFLGGLEDLLTRLESQPGLRSGGPPVDALEAMADLLVDAGITR